jgi:hypothetical protein
VDFVPRAGGSLRIALGLVDQRLRQARRAPAGALRPVLVEETNGEAFGEVLRHELNNPLTGILGNAELLLAEVRRKNYGQLPNGGQQRLQTIAALAVRLRETVRRLSQDWEAKHHPVQQRAAQPGSVQPRTAHKGFIATGHTRHIKQVSAVTLTVGVLFLRPGAWGAACSVPTLIGGIAFGGLSNRRRFLLGLGTSAVTPRRYLS